MRPDDYRKAMQVLNGLNCSLIFLGSLVVRWKKVSELSHQLPPVIVVNYPCHWKSPQSKAENRIHVLHDQGHLATM